MPEQNALPLVWHDSYDAKHYIVAECNALAWQAIQNPQDWPMPVLLVIGGSSSGKTFLTELFSVQHHAAKLVTRDDIRQALQDKNYHVFDNIDLFIKNNPDALEDVFHLVNAAMTDKTPLLLTAQTSPQDWVILPDLLSRLQAANHIMLEEPNDDMIKMAYRKFFTDRGILVDNRVLDYLTMRSERSFAGIRKVVEILDKAALEQSRKITIPLIQNLEIFE